MGVIVDLGGIVSVGILSVWVALSEYEGIEVCRVSAGVGVLHALIIVTQRRMIFMQISLEYHFICLLSTFCR